MLPPQRRLPEILPLIEEGAYFVLHAARQSGKTTLLQSLAASLRESGRFAALVTSCETGQSLEPDLEGSIDAILYVLRSEAQLQLPDEHQPPEISKAEGPRNRVFDLLRRWAQSSPRPIVLLLDEVDALFGDALVSLLRQLRNGFPSRPTDFPQSIALVGLRDVRDYRILSRSDETLGTSSPFNVKSESLTLRNFTDAEVAELYAQHTADTGQVFEPAALKRAFELTQGQPWLVNALARQCVEVLVTDPAQPVTRETVDAAKELLIQRRDTHLDSLIDRLRESRVRRVIAPILAGELLPVDLLDDDVAFVRDLGLVRLAPTGLELANPIYAEIVPRALTQNLEYSLALPSPSYVDSKGRLDFAKLMDDFRAFWLASAEAFLERAPYSEAAAQLVFMAFLHKVVNGGGSIERELAVGRGRVDLCIRWPYLEGGSRRIQSQAIELKVWRDGAPNPLEAGLEQLAQYLERLSLSQGTLLIFQAKKAEPPLPQRQRTELRDHRGLTIEVCWL
jgi:hypothetical protein